MTLVEKLNQDANYKHGDFIKAIKKKWLKSHMRKATENQHFAKLSKRPHKSLTDYCNELYESDKEVIELANAIWSLDDRRKYTTTPINARVQSHVRFYKNGCFRQFLIIQLKDKLKELLNKGFNHPFYKYFLRKKFSYVRKNKKC